MRHNITGAMNVHVCNSLRMRWADESPLSLALHPRGAKCTCNAIVCTCCKDMPVLLSHCVDHADLDPLVLTTMLHMTPPDRQQLGTAKNEDGHMNKLIQCLVYCACRCLHENVDKRFVAEHGSASSTGSTCTQHQGGSQAKALRLLYFLNCR